MTVFELSFPLGHMILSLSQVAGRLHIELSRISGSLVDRMVDDSASESSNDMLRTTNGVHDADDDYSVGIGIQFVCQVLIFLFTGR